MATSGNAHLACHVDGPFHLPPLNFDAVVLNLDEISIAKELMKPRGDLLRLFRSFSIGLCPVQNRPAQLARNAAAQANNSLVMTAPAVRDRCAA